jgi:hypothetical protein
VGPQSSNAVAVSPSAVLEMTDVIVQAVIAATGP